MSVPIDRNLGDVSSLLTVHAEDAAAEVPDAGHRLLLLEVDDPEDAVVGAAGHEVVAAEVLDAGEVGALPLGLDISDHLAAAVVQHLACMERLYGDTSWIEDDCPDTFSEFIFSFPPCSCSV